MQQAEKELQRIELKEKRDLDKHKQLEYLLKQAALYSHFIEKSEKPKPPPQKSKKRKTTTKSRSM